MVKVTLGGKDYELRPLSIRKAREVRQRLAGPVSQVIEAIKGAPKVDITDMQAVGSLLDMMKMALVDSMDLCVETLFDFSPELRADRERIEDQATDEEALSAFVEVVKLLYPLSGVMKKLNGLADLASSMSSPSASGGDGLTSSAMRK